MLKKRILYRLLTMLLVLALAFIVPLVLSIDRAVDTIFQSFRQSSSNLTDYYQLEESLKGRLYNDITIISLYIFFVAFLMALVFSRKILLPIKKLFEGAENIRNGRFDVVLPVLADDELGEVTRTFNSMARSIKEHTEELKKKDLYIKSMMDAMWILDPDNIITDINPSFTKLFGYEQSEAIGLSVFDLLDEENSVIMKYELGDRARKTESSTYQISLTAKDGRQIPVLITSTPIHEDGEVTAKIGVIKDFSDLADLMSKLVESKKQMEEVMDSIDDEMLLIDRDYRIVDANKKAFKVYGENIIGQQCYAVSHESNKPCWISGEECPVQKAFVLGNSWKSVHEHIDSDGVRRYEEILASPIKDMDGQISYVVEMMRDITESKKYEETISRKNRELTTLKEISAILSSSLKAGEIFDEVVTKIAGIFDMDGGGVYILDNHAKMLNCVFHRGVSDDYVKTVGTVRLGEDIPGRVAVSGEAIMVADVSKDYRIDRSVLRYSGIKGYCCIPIKGKERLLGVLCLFGIREHYFTDEEQRILASVGEMSGIALENISLYEKMKELFGQQRRRRIQEQQLLLELAGRISASSDTRQSVRSTIELIRNYLKAGAVWYAFVRDFGHISIGVSDGLDESDLPFFIPEHALSLERAVANSGEYMIVEDISADKRYFVPEVISRHNFRTAVCIPVKIKGSTTGVITLFFRNMTLVKEEDIHFLLIASNMLSVSIEISELYEKRILEKSLAETVFDNISDGVCTVDTEGLVTSANNAFGRMLGIPLENILKKHFSAVIPHDEGPVSGGNNRCPVSKALQGERGIAEMQFIRPDGTELILQVSSSPLQDPKGDIRGAVQVVRDISKEKEIDSLKSDLVRNVSHEFRTPLSAIVGMTEMLLDRDVSGERAVEYLKTMYSEGMRLSHMISDLLDLSRIETGRDRINVTRIPVADFMEEIKRTFSHALQTKNASLEFRIEKGIDTVWADKNRIRQVFINLITNSLTYSDRGVKIIISLKKESNFFIIEMKDTGWGIGAHDLVHIGEKFFRGSYAHITKGTGLGIALCEEIIRMHGGVLEITSEIPEGTLIVIRIPMRESI